ncbi:hypothetical protein D3C72_648030 [compost metagenome]
MADWRWKTSPPSLSPMSRTRAIMASSAARSGCRDETMAGRLRPLKAFGAALMAERRWRINSSVSPRAEVAIRIRAVTRSGAIRASSRAT